MFRLKLFLCLLLAAGSISAQEADFPRTSDGKPDLSGIWQALTSANWDVEGHPASQGAVETLGAIGAVIPDPGIVVEGNIPYLASALGQRNENFLNRRTGDTEARCFMGGIPRSNYMPHPFQIFQTDGDIMMVYQYAGGVRNIFMNPDDQMEAPVDSWMGWSNGRWEGDTLVVEVSGLMANWLDRSGNFATEGLRVTERYTPMSPWHLMYEATLEDPAVFERPWTVRFPLYKRMEENARVMEFKCPEFAEEILYGHLRKPGTGGSE